MRIAFTLSVLLALAQEPTDCLIRFAAVSEVASDPLPLVRETYRELWDVLGSKVPPEVIRKIVEGKDPFALPAELGVEALGKRLRELHEMLKEKEWYGVEVRGQLIADLAQRGGALTVAGEQVKKAVESGWRNYTITFPSDAYVSHLADGRSLGVQIFPDHGTEFFIRDPGTPQVAKVKGARIPGALSMKLGADGTELFYAKRNGSLQAVPYRDGRPDFENARPVGHERHVPDWDEVNPALIVGATKLLLVKTGLSLPKAQIFDRQKNLRAGLQLDGYLGDKTAAFSSIGFVPGTDSVFILTKTPEDEGNEFHRVTVNDDGKLTRSMPPLVWKETAFTNAAYLGDRKNITFYSRREIALLAEGASVPVKVYPPPEAPPLETWAFGNIRGVLAHRTENAAAVITSEDRNRGPYTVEWLNFDTKKVEARFKLPPTETVLKAQFSGDGEAILYDLGNGAWHVVNYREQRQAGLTK